LSSQLSFGERSRSGEGQLPTLVDRMIEAAVTLKPIGDLETVKEKKPSAWILIIPAVGRLKRGFPAQRQDHATSILRWDKGSK